MAGRRIQHLARREGVYYVRIPVPADLIAVVGRREIRWSLKVRDRASAADCALRATLAFRDLCARLRDMAAITDDTLRAEVREHMAKRVASDPPDPNLAENDHESRQHLERTVHDVIARLQAMIEADLYDPDHEGVGDLAAIAHQEGQALAQQLSLSFDTLPPEQKRMLLEGVARASLEEYRKYLHRLTNRLAPYTPADPLLQTPVAQAVAATTNIPASTSLTFRAACDAYIAAKADTRWTPRTKAENERVFRQACEHFGEDTPLAAITKDDVRAFRDAVVSIRVHAPPGAPFKEIVGAPKAKAIDAKTAAKYFGYVAAAFTWWVDEQHLAASPVGKIGVVLPKSKKAADNRVPFSQAEMATLFTSPMFTSCRGATGGHRMKPGDQKVRDGFFWIPLVGALSGMRLGEIVQLLLVDVHLDNTNVPFMRVQEHEGQEGTVKSDAGWRDVPIHSRLEALGFHDFVRTRRKEGQVRLFHDVRFGSKGQPSGYYSQWFGRKLDAVGLTKKGLVFHSFRHSFIDALRNASAPGYIIKAIVGHDQGDDVTSGYGTDVDRVTRKEWIDRIAYLDALPPDS